MEKYFYSILFIISLIVSTYISIEELWKPLSIIITLGLLSYFMTKNLIKTVGVISWGLFGYICATLFIMGYQIISPVITTFILTLSFWIPEGKQYKLSSKNVTIKIMSFLIIFIPSLLLKIT